MFSPLAINKNPQLGIVGTSAGAVLSIAGWVMGSQSEKSIKLQAKVEEQTEAIFLRRLGMEYELEKFRDIRYLNESQQAIAQPKSHDQTLPPSQQRRSDDNEGNLHRSQLMVLDRESPVEYNQENYHLFLAIFPPIIS
jgi:hypothetical protein